MKTRPLGRSGMTVPVLSLGAAGFGDVYGTITQDDADSTIAEALDLGVNLFDTSPHYGLHRSEEVLGRAIAHHPRDAYMIATKCGRLGDHWDFSADAIRRSIPESMERLGIDYIDLIQCHDIEEGDVDQVRREALPVLREFKEQGIVKHIGITGYVLEILETVAIAEGVESVMSYCNYNLQDRRLLATAQKLKSHGVGVLAASPLHMSALTKVGAPEWHPGRPEMLARTRDVVRICEKHGTTIEEVSMRFALDLPDDSAISTTVVGVAKPERLRRNVEAINNPVDANLIDEIEEAFGEELNRGWLAPLKDHR